MRFPTIVAAIAAAGLCMSSGSAHAQPAPAAPTDLKETHISADGMVAVCITAAAPSANRPAVLVLGGSEGGIRGAQMFGEALARRGYAVMALAYFGLPGLPEVLEEVPLEYLERGLDRLRAEPGIDTKRIGVLGVSKGAEAALLLASRRPDLHAVVVSVPSSVVWQGINLKSQIARSSWSEHGKPLPFTPYDGSKPFTGLLDLYVRSLPAAPADAFIPVEKIGGPILLISAGDDQVWPSEKQSDQIVERLNAHHFRFKVEHIDYPGAGHGVLTPAPYSDQVRERIAFLGGSAEVNRRAEAEAWPKAMAFLDAVLKP